MRKGDRVTVSGVGRTRTWGKYSGTVTRVRGQRVFVRWDGTHFEDEMTSEEVREVGA